MVPAELYVTSGNHFKTADLLYFSTADSILKYKQGCYQPASGYPLSLFQLLGDNREVWP